MGILSLAIPWQAKAVAGLAAAGAIFVGGWTVKGWRDSGELDTEKLAHQADVSKLSQDWLKNVQAATERANKAEAQQQIDQENDRQARLKAETDYERKLATISASSAANAATSQRLRDDLAAAIAAGRVTAARADCVQEAGPGASCSGSSGGAICELLSRALDLASRCSADAERQHAAVTEAVGAWPKAGD